MGAMSLTAGIIGAWLYVEPELPPAETIREIPLQIPLRIFSRDGYLIDELGERRRILITYDDLPQHVVDAFVAAEDRRFWVHPGVDYVGILRAVVLLASSGEISGGGSTLTQQLARDYFLTRDPTFVRKLREAFLAYKIEQEFSKQEILALFLNKMFFGQRAYGVAAAAQVYFGKNLRDINAAEAATLAGVLPAPSKYNPVSSANNALVRRGYVLGRMYDLDMIDEQLYDASSDYPMESRLHGTKTELLAPYVGEMVRREMLERFGEATYSAGYKVITTLDSRFQRAANYSLRNGLLEFTRRRGYRGPFKKVTVNPQLLRADYADWPEELRLALGNENPPGGLQVAIVTQLDEAANEAKIVLQSGEIAVLPWYGISWARPYVNPVTTGAAPQAVGDVLQPGDLIHVMAITTGDYALTQLPVAQSAVVTVDPQDGAITSLAGGYDFAISKFNRVTQAIRQPGSSFKPFIYAAALSQGNTLATVLFDSPVVINSAALERLWRPINYSGRFYGEQRMREALVRSMNLASVRLLLDSTGVGNTVRYLEAFGFNDSALPRNGSLALGGGNATPLDMAQAYATIANGGYAVTPYVIDSISGPEGDVLYRANPKIVCRECEIEPDLAVLQEMAAEDMLQAQLELEELEGTNSAAIRDEQTLEDLFPGVDVAFLSAEQLASIAESYRPDANVAPELFDGINAAPRIMSERIAFLIQDAMRSVVRRGTGVRAWRELRRSDLSGKTGTSNDRRDAWFAGFNSFTVGIVWVGFDDDAPLGPREEGSRTALPIWIELMRAILDGTPLSQMDMPEGIITVRINKTSGCPAKATDPYDSVMFEVFREEYVPECDEAEEATSIFNSFEEEVMLPEGLDEDLEEDEEAAEEESIF